MSRTTCVFDRVDKARSDHANFKHDIPQQTSSMTDQQDREMHCPLAYHVYPRPEERSVYPRTSS